MDTLHTSTLATLEDDVVILGGYGEAYSKACQVKDYPLCDRLRASLAMFMHNKCFMIKIDNDLGLSKDL